MILLLTVANAVLLGKAYLAFHTDMEHALFKWFINMCSLNFSTFSNSAIYIKDNNILVIPVSSLVNNTGHFLSGFYCQTRYNASILLNEIEWWCHNQILLYFLKSCTVLKRCFSQWTLVGGLCFTVRV
jgi:hypothetical protein